MSFSILKEREYENIQKKKIAYFFTKIGDIDYFRADRYLSKANWDEKLAVKYFYVLHPNYIPPFTVQINPFSNDNYELKSDIKNENNNNFQNNHLEINIDETLIKFSYKSIINNKYLEALSQNTKSIQKIFITFIKLLKNFKGVIIIFSEGSFNRFLGQTKYINEKNIDKNIIKKFVIFPLLDDSPLGKELVKKLTIVSFPAYIFCKYINDKKIFVTDKMEGAFEISFFIDCIKKDIPEQKEIDSINKCNKYVKTNDNQSNINIKFENNKNNDNEKSKNYMNNILNENNFIDNTFSYKKDIGKNQNILINHNEDNYKNHNKINLNNDLDEFQKEKLYLDNKDFIDFIEKDKQINNQFQEKKYLNNYIKENKENKEKDKEKNNNLELNDYNNNEFYYNKNNFNKINNSKDPSTKNNLLDKKENDLGNLKLFENDNNNILLDYIYNLSDGQIFAKIEKEMKELERQQEEKEKKEEEEKKKEIEEEKRIKNIEKKYEFEAKIAKMILPEEPEANNPDKCHIIFRFPDGEKKIERNFLKTEKIAVLYDYIKSIGREIFTEPDSNDFDIICLGFPPKNLEDKKGYTLLDEGLFPNSILQIREK